MATYEIGTTAPYVAANGHEMVAPIHQSDREGAKPFTIHSWAWCVDTCRACNGGGSPADYCGEVEYDDEPWCDGDRW